MSDKNGGYIALVFTTYFYKFQLPNMQPVLSNFDPRPFIH